MADKSININDIKPIESFSVDGCHYFKTEEGEVQRSCLERLSWEWADVDLKVAKGADPEKAAKKKQKIAAKIVKMEVDQADTLARYKEVIDVQKGIIALFRNKIDFSQKSNRVEKTESGHEVYIPNPVNDSNGPFAINTKGGIEMSFKDLDEDGSSDFLDIDQMIWGYQNIGNCGCASIVFPSEYTVGYARAHMGFSDYSYILSGQSFEPLISSLLTFIKEA